MSRGSLIATAWSVLAFAGHGAAQDENARPPFDKMERALAKAVGSVSRPAAVPGAGAADLVRGYRMRGVGAWFVVSPRSFPERSVGRGRQDPDLLSADSALADAIRRLESGVSEAESEQDKATFLGNIEQLQDKRRDLRARAQAAAERERALTSIQERALAMHQAAEEARREAEKTLTLLEQRFGRRLEAGTAPERSAAEALPPLPPWRIWIQSTMPEETRSPDIVLQDVRHAILTTIEREGASLPLSGSEMIAVAVDFFRPTVSCPAPPARTLVMRVPKRVLDARQAGEIDDAALRKEIEVQEY